MKRILIILSIALFIGQLVCQFTSAQDNVVLQDNEIPGMIIERPIRISYWTIALVKGMPVDMEAVEQFATIQGLKAIIKYAEFANTNEAHQAVTWHSTNMQSVFYPGLWDGAQTNSIGDESWYSPNPWGGNTILFRSGRICVLAGCYGEGDREKQNQIADLLSKPIEDKIKKGGLVILPYDEPECTLLRARVTLKPEALDVSPGILTAFVRLPDGYPVTNIISATCDGALYERMMPNEDGTEMIIKFRRKDIEAALAQWGSSIDTLFVVRGGWRDAIGNFRDFHGVGSITKIVGAKGANLSRSGRE